MQTDAGNSAQASGSAGARCPRLVIADDERDTLLTLSAILTDEGYAVVTATSGPAAIMEIRLEVPDAVIVDINMPGLSGYDVAREVRRLYGQLAPKLIAISGKWTGQTDRMLAELAGFQHFLPKPFDPQALLDLLAPLRAATSTPAISLMDETVVRTDPSGATAND
jgi:two-component system, OmpR family, response regulator